MTKKYNIVTKGGRETKQKGGGGGGGEPRQCNLQLNANFRLLYIYCKFAYREVAV
jgi:hypothetical protein